MRPRRSHPGPWDLGDDLLLVLEVVDARQERRQLGQLVERGDADALQEVARGPVEVRTGLVVGAGLLDQAARQQRAHHAVDVDPADRGDAAAADRLLVGHHGQGLERGLRQAGLLPVEHEPLHDRGEVLAGVVAPAAGHVAQLEAAARLVVLRDQGVQRLDHLGHGVADRGRQGRVVQRLVGDHQHGLQGGTQLGERAPRGSPPR